MVQLFNFTLAKSRLVCDLVRGYGLTQIAARTGLSMNTLKHHLKSVFTKTNTHRQAELISFVLMNPALWVISIL